MAKKERILHASAEEIQAMRKQGKTRSDWAAADSEAKPRLSGWPMRTTDLCRKVGKARWRLGCPNPRGR